MVGAMGLGWGSEGLVFNKQTQRCKVQGPETNGEDSLIASEVFKNGRDGGSWVLCLKDSQEQRLEHSEQACPTAPGRRGLRARVSRPGAPGSQCQLSRGWAGQPPRLPRQSLALLWAPAGAHRLEPQGRASLPAAFPDGEGSSASHQRRGPREGLPAFR